MPVIMLIKLKCDHLQRERKLQNKFCFTRSSSGRGTVSSSSSVVGLSQVVWWSQRNCHHAMVLQGEPCRAEDERGGAAVWERGCDRHTVAGQREVSLGHTGQVGSIRTLLQIWGFVSVFREKREGSRNGELYLSQHASGRKLVIKASINSSTLSNTKPS